MVLRAGYLFSGPPDRIFQKNSRDNYYNLSPHPLLLSTRTSCIIKIARGIRKIPTTLHKKEEKIKDNHKLLRKKPFLSKNIFKGISLCLERNLNTKKFPVEFTHTQQYCIEDKGNAPKTTEILLNNPKKNGWHWFSRFFLKDIVWPLFFFSLLLSI